MVGLVIVIEILAAIGSLTDEFADDPYETSNISSY
jgi:hypothetical protein